MKTGSLISALLFLVQTLLSGQDDPAATAVLDRFASVAKAAPSVSMEFEMIANDAIEKRTDTLKGKVVIAGDRYRLTMPESTTWFNGTDSWNYMPSVKEVTITRPSGEETSFMAKPSLLFEMYRKDYRSKIVESTLNHDIIELIPVDNKTDIIRVRLTIGRKSSDLISAEYRTRNGLTATLRVKDYNLRFKPDSKYFDFNPADFKGVEIIDMR